MSLIYVNGHGYADDAPVDWNDAIEAGGFYFTRALCLGLPEPPAILFDEDNPGYLKAMARYHERFVNAELLRISQDMELSHTVPADDEPDFRPWRHQEDGF